MYVAFHSETQWQREVIIQGYHWLQLNPPLLVITVIIKMSIIFYQKKKNKRTICKSFKLCLIKNAKDKKSVLSEKLCLLCYACVFFQ